MVEKTEIVWKSLKSLQRQAVSEYCNSLDTDFFRPSITVSFLNYMAFMET